MFQKLRSLRDSMLEGFWFLPLIMVATTQAVVTPLLVFGLDPGAWLIEMGLPWLATGLLEAAKDISAPGMRAVLSVIAGGMITLVSIVFSLSFVALTLTSQQLGPRIIDYWLRANATQLLLGMSLSAFFAALTGLLSLAVTEQAGRPVLLGGGLATILGALALVEAVLFATSMSDAIRADVTVARLGDAFVAAVRTSCTRVSTDVELSAAAELADLARAEGRAIPARRAGYLSAADMTGIAAMARDRDLRVAMIARENDYLMPGRPVALVLGAADAAAEDVADALDGRLTLTVRRRRTGMADFEGDALTEVALRALSPSMNDPFTAIACIDRIGEGCVVLASAGSPRRAWMAEGMAVAMAPGAGADWLFPRLLHPLIHAAEGQPLVLERLAERAGDLRRVGLRHEDRASASAVLDRVGRAASRLTDTDDRALVDLALAAARDG
ncbi:MAG: putative membrane protein [Paracoccaceae bacterium]|jgi:uncharacterized membrane protein